MVSEESNCLHFCITRTLSWVTLMNPNYCFRQLITQRQQLLTHAVYTFKKCADTHTACLSLNISSLYSYSEIQLRASNHNTLIHAALCNYVLSSFQLYLPNKQKRHKASSTAEGGIGLCFLMCYLK